MQASSVLDGSFPWLYAPDSNGIPLDPRTIQEFLHELGARSSRSNLLYSRSSAEKRSTHASCAVSRTILPTCEGTRLGAGYHTPRT